MSAPESGNRSLRLGFIPLNDCAPLAVAQSQGLFEAEGLEVELLREPSWANIRDKLAAGAIDGAHMLAPMTLAAALGAGSEPLQLAVPFALAKASAAFTVSAALSRAGGAGKLAEVAHQRRDAGAPLRFAVVFPYSSHNYLLRLWLADQGIDPDRDVRITVSPPPRMGEQLASGLIDGFCAGEPWNALAVSEGLGAVAMRAHDVKPDAPDKVLGLTSAFAEQQPETVAALVRALAAACAWIGKNRAETAELLAAPAYVGAPAALIATSLRGADFASNRPEPADGAWLLEQMARWGQIGFVANPAAFAARTFRPDLFDGAVA